MATHTEREWERKTSWEYVRKWKAATFVAATKLWAKNVLINSIHIIISHWMPHSSDGNLMRMRMY